MHLTIEEAALVGVFDHKTKEEAIRDIRKYLPECNDPMFTESLRVILIKLWKMTEEEFQKTDFMEDMFDDDENEDESGSDLSFR